MTKKIQFLIDERKGYTGTFYLGKTTDSYDLETEPKGEEDIEFVNIEVLRLATKDFLGKQQQTPPVFSAKKVDGKRAYDLARKGEEIKLKSNDIEIFDFEITDYKKPEASFEVLCSKGTYIRSLANDMGVSLGCGAYLSSLRRISSGDFHLNQAMTLDEFEDRIRQLPSEKA